MHVLGKQVKSPKGLQIYVTMRESSADLDALNFFNPQSPHV